MQRRGLFGDYFEWSKAAGALLRLWHEVAVAPDAAALADAIQRADALKQREQAAWDAFVSATRDSTG